MSKGELFVVATPIGNLDDLSPRAAATLGRADLVCCEDTRHTGAMLKRLSIKTKRLVSLHAHNERERIGQILEALEEGATVALVSDAGTPGVSDPGERVVKAVAEAGFVVSPVPGPSAVVAALAVSGAPIDRWVFEGFLPRRGAERRSRLEAIAGSDRTVVVYESPLRLPSTLRDLAAVCGGDRAIAVCRELTKLHEEVVRTSLLAAVVHFQETQPRGELTLVIHPRPPAERGKEPPPADVLRAEVEELVGGGASRRDAVGLVAERRGVARRLVYDAAVRDGAAERDGAAVRDGAATARGRTAPEGRSRPR